MKKIIKRFVSLASLCACLAVVSLTEAANDNARVPECERERCVDYMLSCGSFWNSRTRSCETFCNFDPTCVVY